MPWTQEEREQRLQATLVEMKKLFESDPSAAVRSQGFIKIFHAFIADDLRSFLTTKATSKAGVRVVEEAKIFGSFKSKDVDVAVVHPINGPLILAGVRSQMSSIRNNVLTYYQDIVGEAISLQERFPMTVTGYAYVHPHRVVPLQKADGKRVKPETPDHARYARMYASIGMRDDRLYKQMTGAYDEFAYTVVDFQTNPIAVRDDIVARAVPDLDMSIRTFVPRLVSTFHKRNLWVEDIFEPPGTGDYPAEDVAADAGLDETLTTDPS